MDFDQAPSDFADKLAIHLGTEEARRGRIVRDVFGRMSFVLKQKPSSDKLRALTVALTGSANQFVDLAGSPVAVIDKESFDQICAEPFYLVSTSSQNGLDLKLIDRKLVGDEWLTCPQVLQSAPSILVFYSIKGGVGRSTALAITAAYLASQGKNVLTLDFDLEAPALGNLLLENRTMPAYGSVDLVCRCSCWIRYCTDFDQYDRLKFFYIITVNSPRCSMLWVERRSVSF